MEINEKPTVAVLLSTYNGEKYIEALIESVLRQEAVNVQLIIRDDGSLDKTIDIIKKFSDDRIQLHIGNKNLGPAKSFLKLTQYVEKADYCAYCDQDDIWKKDKLKRGINRLSKSNSNTPALYMSTYEVVDKNLNLLFVRDMEYERPLTLEQTILCRAPSGCTMVFNNALLQKINKKIPQYVRMHDFWTLLTVEAFHGDIYTDEYASLQYRQHGDNSVGIIPTPSDRFKRLVNSVKNHKNERSLQARSLYACYKDELPQDTEEVLLEVINYRRNIKNKFHFLFDKNFRWSPYVNTLFWASVITGTF